MRFNPAITDFVIFLSTLINNYKDVESLLFFRIKMLAYQLSFCTIGSCPPPTTDLEEVDFGVMVQPFF